MGRTLQQTAISTNIKERLDFSCALFDINGDLVANAPHVPIHLGAMSFAVKAQMKLWENKLEPGDVLVTNHPIAGGSHLPDITVITPVLDKNNKPIFWTASRGHHADIGSIAAGSMPPNSKTIHDEGAAIVTHKLCARGEFDEAGITRLLVDEPAKHPGGSGTRTLSDNISDLKAQVAANNKGISLLDNLVQEFGYDVIELYMSAIQSTAETAVRSLLRLAFDKFGGEHLKAVDYLDDGTAIALEITIDPESGSAVFDFTESGDEMYGNLNAPKAILYSAVLYVLRSLVSTDIPLNNGCLKPITFKTRDSSVVSPSAEAAVVGGNVECTQRIVDVMLKAFEAAAASQGTCNNFTFGVNDKENKITFGYYETICGGSGAGPTWDGQSVVQCHTTNTRITDSELFEKRYPIILHEYSVRRDSGGKGLHKGGDGCIRDIEFTYTGLEVSCLMERRSLAPFGLLGGEDGSRGKNYWIRKSEEGQYRKLSLGGKCTFKVTKGDRVIIMTPGGGGFGSSESQPDSILYPIASSKPSILTGSVGMRSRTQETN
jgi:5-oxoprolinase (ATP-hydrolysing)